MQHILSVSISMLILITILASCTARSSTSKIQITNNNTFATVIPKNTIISVVKPELINTCASNNQIVINFFGKYKITKLLSYAPNSIYTSTNIESIIGLPVNYTIGAATYNCDICKDPFYKPTPLTSAQFEETNNLPLSSLGITSSTITQITIYTSKTTQTSDTLWNSCGSIIFYTPDKKLILFDGLAYFLLGDKV